MVIRGALSRDVQEPVRGHAHDAGMDFYVPTFSPAFVHRFTVEIPEGAKEKGEDTNVGIDINKDRILLKPGQGAMIPSGVHMEIPIGYMGLYLNKSGVATKKRLLIGAQVIDTFYDGECHINVNNVSDRDVEIKPGEKLTQMVLVPVAHASFLKVDLDTLYSDMREEDHRGDGGFGSTDKK